MTEKSPTPRTRLRRRLLIGAGAVAVGASAVGIGLLTSRKGGALVPGHSRARPIASDTALPSVADVVVVGGGNVGCLAALTLAERGVRVVLCEKGAIAGEASGRSLGYIDSLFLDPVKAAIVGRSKQLWEGMANRVAGDTGYRRCGVAALFSTDDGVDFAKPWLAAMQGSPGIDSRILGPREAAALAVGSPDRPVAALYDPTDGIAEPQLAAPAIADQVRRLGGRVFTHCAVRGVETTGGKISAVVTEMGRIACSSVIVAGGIWSPIFLRSIGLDLPQFMAFGSAMRFAPTQGPSVGIVSLQRHVVLRRGLDGSYDVCKPVASTPVTPSTVANLSRLVPALKNMADQLEPVLNVSTFISQWRIPNRWPLDRPSPFEETRIFMPETRTDMLEEVAAQMRAGFPDIGNSRVADRWAGAMMTTLDNMPVISAVDARPGLFVGSGFYYGLTMAPAAGEALADLVMGDKPQFDLNLYRFSRFSDGSPIVFRS
jgi:glycine/D-amino acid oxidase-like deaminating enzyme